MPKSSTPASKARKHHLKRLKAIENISPAILFQSIQSKCVQTESIVMSTKTTNTPNYFHDMLEYGKKMTDEQFERFLKDRASDCYWRILAERARLQLEEKLRENRQLHELFDELTKENEQLNAKSERCEYLTNVFNSITSDCDSGIELHLTDESPLRKQTKAQF